MLIALDARELVFPRCLVVGSSLILALFSIGEKALPVRYENSVANEQSIIS